MVAPPPGAAADPVRTPTQGKIIARIAAILPAADLEREAKCEHAIVIICVEVRRRNLESAAERQRQPLMNRNSSNHQSRRHEDLRLGVVGAVREMRVVHLELRPEFVMDAVLERVVPWERPADRTFVARGQRRTERALVVEIAEPFPVGNGGRDVLKIHCFSVG